MVSSFFSVLLFYLSAANAYLAGASGTCTSGSSFLSGGLYSVILYPVAGYLLYRARFLKTVLVFLIPVVPALVWQCVLAFQLADGIFRKGLSACDVTHGYGQLGFDPDGNETVYVFLWLTLAVVGVVVPMIVTWWRLHRSD